MVEQAIAKYLNNGGKAPYGVAFGEVVDAVLPEVPPHVMSATIPALKYDCVVVMPLQALLDMVINSIFVLEEDDDE